MGRLDHEDAVARALDLLPDGDPAKSDPRMLRDPALAEEGRLVRETAADVWLAVSPLQAAPSEVLDEVMEKIGAPSRVSGRRSSGMRWLAAGGWAAALALAAAWWLSKEPESPGEIVMEDLPTRSARPVVGVRGAVPPRPVAAAPERERRLREEIARLRDALTTELGVDDAFRPQVIRLKSPTARYRSPEEDRERLHTILSKALLSALEVESGAPNDPASIVIERGWLPQGFAMQEDEVIRHRNFPEDSWAELGLLKSDEGGYYDPEAGLVWTADEEGRGFIGRRAGAGDDLSVYRQPEPGDTTAIAANKAGPEGFVISDPATGKAQVVLEGLPAPAEGIGQWLVYSNASGQMNEIALVSPHSNGLLGGGVANGSSLNSSGIYIGDYWSGSYIGGGYIIPIADLFGGASVTASLRSATLPFQFWVVEASLTADGSQPKVLLGSGTETPGALRGREKRASGRGED